MNLAISAYFSSHSLSGINNGQLHDMNEEMKKLNIFGQKAVLSLSLLELFKAKMLYVPQLMHRLPTFL